MRARSTLHRTSFALATGLLPLTIGWVPLGAAAAGAPAPSVPFPIALSALSATYASAREPGAEPQASDDGKIAARGLDTSITWEELDEVLLARRAMSKDGKEALRHLAESHMLEVLGTQNGLTVSDAEIEARVAELDKASNGLADKLKEARLTLEEFKRFLRLANVQETLTRRALGLKDTDPVTAEQQKLWMNDALMQREYKEFNAPWSDGVVARSGEFEIRQPEFMAYLRQRLPEETLREDCWQLLLSKRMRARMPDLAPEKLAAAVREELQRRREETKRDPRYKGVPWESLLATQGILVDRMDRDPGVLVAALSKLWVERSYDDATLQRTYKDERELFDGAYGAAVDTSMLFLRAAAFKNEFNPRTFAEAEKLLTTWRESVRTVDDFHTLAKEKSEDAATREATGHLGYLTARSTKVPIEVQNEVARAVSGSHSANAQESMVGPLRVSNGCVLLWFGARRPAPSWDVMSQHVRNELRRRFVDDVLPRSKLVVNF